MPIRQKNGSENSKGKTKRIGKIEKRIRQIVKAAARGKIGSI